MDEVQLVRKAEEGSRYFLAQLLYENYEVVYRYLIKFTLNKTAAEDLTQEAMVKAIEKFDLYDSSRAAFATWLISIARNVYLDQLRKKKHEQKYVADGSEDIRELLGSGSYDGDFSDVLQALGKLEEQQRFPLVMKHYYGYSYEDIAKMMSIPVGTVKSRIYNAVRCVREELDQNDAGEG